MQNETSVTKLSVSTLMTRRRFLGIAGAAALPMVVHATPLPDTSVANVGLCIVQRTLEISPQYSVKTVVYEIDGGESVVRLPSDKPVNVKVVNTLSTEEWVHWHGLRVPTSLDGTEEEGSLSVSAGRTLRYTLPPQRPGLFYVHSHAMTCHDMSRGLYGGQFAPVYVQPHQDAGDYDREFFWTSHEWEPYMVNEADEERAVEEMQHLRIDPEDGDEAEGWDVRYRLASVNGRALGHGEPIRVRERERVLFHLLNASATENIQIALPGHVFQVIAMDGHPVPRRDIVSVLDLGAGERIDAVVAMNAPGVWVFGSTDEQVRAKGLGVVVEYAGHTGDPVWSDLAAPEWNYAIFCNDGYSRGGEEIKVSLERLLPGENGAERWSLMLKDSNRQPHEGVLYKGHSYRLRLQNQSDEWHPMHLHRHRFELLRYHGKDVAGLMKDTLLIPPWEEAEILLTPEDVGPALFHCHNQMHMEAGLHTLFTVL